MDFPGKTYSISRIKPKLLSDFVNWFTVYHFNSEDPVKLHPEGYFELIFQLDSNFVQSSSTTEKWESRPRQFIGGLHNKSYYIKPESKSSSLISVNFKPNCARYFIPDKLHLYKNKLVSLDDIWSRSKLGQIEALSPSKYIAESVGLIESFLIGIYTEQTNSRVDFALNSILQRQGFVNIRELAQIACLSESQFRKRFNEEVGMSPKEYSKIVRIKFVSTLLHKHPETNLTELTYELGYFDQSHFIKDFKSVTGISPKHFLT
jgi:AraC-like DNA-binding protein